MKYRGFTLLETVIVLAIMTMFFAVSIPFFSKFTEGAKLDTTARSIASTLRTARTYAITKNLEYYVVFSMWAEPHSYFISIDSSGAAEKVEKLPPGISFTTMNFTKGTDANAACFRPTGELDEDNPDTSVVITDGTNTKTITVERTTGRARID